MSKLYPLMLLTVSIVFSVGNNEGNEMELQDEMGDECDNNFRGKDDDNDDRGEENDENDDNYQLIITTTKKMMIIMMKKMFVMMIVVM